MVSLEVQPLRSSFGKVFMGAAGGGEDLPSDDQFNRVSFLSHFDGANNGVNNAFDDGSTSNHTITANGNVTQGSFGPFARPDGEWGVALDGPDSFLRATGAGDISGDFTIETWVFMNSDDGNYISLTYISGGIINVIKVLNGTTQNFLFGTSSGAEQTTLEFTDTTWDAGVWTHLALVRSSGTLKMYVNGVADATTSTAVSGNLTDLEYIGTGRGFTSDNRIFDGKVSNVRFSSTARYTSNFTPPTAPFTTDSDTNLLTCQSNRFVDNSSNGYTITPAGSAAVTAFGPFLTSSVYDPAVNGASAYFDGDGDYLSVPDSADWDFGSGNYTVEFWIYPRTTGTIQGLVNHWADFNLTNVAWSFEWHSNGNINYYIKTNTASHRQIAAVGGASIANQWMHVAAARNNNVHTLYLDGVSKATVTDAGTMNNCTDILRVGDYWDGNYGFDGEICDVRVVKGTAVYTSNFTPPTAPLTAITNTKLLLNMADGQAIDSAAQNNLTLYGNANTSTDQAKFGDTSLHLDGNGDYAYIPETENFTFGTGDFTIEFWYYGDATQNDYLFDMRVSADNEARASVYFNSGNKLSYYTSNTTRITSNTALSTSTWTHIALVRSSAVTRFYFNGTQDNQSFSDTLDMPSAQLVIGGKYTDDSQRVTGYFDDFRISRMARYTSNFTAPTEPFADKGR